MDEFNYLVTLFSLLLGFAVAELVGAFGRAFRAEAHVHVGWLTPLLGVGVLIDIASFWLSIWDMRDLMRAHMASILIGLAYCGGYYLIALQAAPPDDARWRDFDEWYWRVKKRVAVSLVAVNLAIFALQWLVLREHLALTPYAVANLLYLALLAGIAVAPGKWLNLVLLTLNIALFAASATYGALHR